MSEALTKSEFARRVAEAQRRAGLRAARFKGDNAATQLARKARALVEPGYFGRVYLPHYFTQETPGFHEVIYAALEHSLFLTVRAPRAHAKTTAITFLTGVRQAACAPVLRAWTTGTLEATDKPLFDAITLAIEAEAKRRQAFFEAAKPDWQHAALLIRPKLRWDPYIQVVSVIEDQAIEFTTAIKQELETNDALRGDWGELIDDVGVNYHDFVTRSGIRIKAFGMNGSVRGGKHGPHRPSLVLIDDPDDKKTVSNPKLRDEQWRKVNADIRFGLERGGRLFMIGTPVHADCVVCRAMRPEETRFNKIRFSARRPDGSPLWPAKWTEEELAHEEATNPEAQSELFDEPPAEGEQPFRGTMGSYRRAELALLTDAPTVAFLDPSLGRTRKSDFAALAALAFPKDGRILVKRGELWRLPPRPLVTAANAVIDAEDPDLAGVEAIGAQELFALLLNEASPEGLRGYAQVTVHGASKEMRIMGLKALAPRICWPDDGSCDAFKRQVEAWPAGDHDDAPDCLEMAISLRRRAASVDLNGVRHVRRRFAANEDEQTARAKRGGGRRGLE